MFSECYRVLLQCNFHEDAVPMQFFGDTPTKCWNYVRAAGWQAYPAQGLAKCPECSARAKAERLAKAAEKEQAAP